MRGGGDEGKGNKGNERMEIGELRGDDAGGMTAGKVEEMRVGEVNGNDGRGMNEGL